MVVYFVINSVRDIRRKDMKDIFTDKRTKTSSWYSVDDMVSNAWEG